eukprot:gnl/MRDRNA2_/MRDRNA2_180791_c0_seq1.p1 gnl/MRDRNA2_/MRDRNA2_180791_c0~~gnl/MRDRNA2_/MRDRNA2_180791_c0_seq1.p1  ORF type:complete len:286 (-),score=53.37 gnl/MRDRNA2_/MRDRNA2_180791_c0_seq1:408-1265(-)
MFSGSQDQSDATLLKNANKNLSKLWMLPVDGWGIPYNLFKEFLRPWKIEAFVPHIKAGDAIYESACGTGLNLLLTTEILKEHGIQLTTVYGNDYLQQHVDIANEVWDTPTSREVARKGIFCTADSSNLDFVPSSSFDFVYTGYIDPIQDPLNLLPSTMTASEKKKRAVGKYRSLDSELRELAQKEQSAQEDWYASWVTEMIRIAKPGKTIVIENNAESLWQDPGDWGGVDKNWWAVATSKYGWDVDPNSIVVRDMPRRKQWRQIRYHVMMQKNERKMKFMAASDG